MSESIAKAIKKFGLKVTFCRLRNNLHNLLYNKKDKTKSDYKCGVYAICCLNCKNIYIGESKRYLKDRVNEHKRYVKNNVINNSSITEHCIVENVLQ